MKKYIRSANKLTNKATQLVSKAYTEEGIARRAAEGSHKGESMAQIYQNIMNDPDISFGEVDKEGNQDILYKGKNIGWINFRRQMGWIDDKPYQKLQKYVEPDPEEFEGFEDPSWDDYRRDTYSDEEFDDDVPSADY